VECLWVRPEWTTRKVPHASRLQPNSQTIDRAEQACQERTF